MSEGQMATAHGIYSGERGKERCLVCGAFGEVILCAKHADGIHRALSFHGIDLSVPHKSTTEDDIKDMTRPS